jgi:hypothetical protein
VLKLLINFSSSSSLQPVGPPLSLNTHRPCFSAITLYLAFVASSPYLSQNDFPVVSCDLYRYTPSFDSESPVMVSLWPWKVSDTVSP